ncbi:MAG: shikimate kinase [Deltaproteobacteria bacterium]|nr:shikimate kinase [Deltaproteobacteria bacterium]
MIVTLVGLMGSGKSTVARALAARWPGFGALDLDARIEARAGRTIAEIFAADGEPGFRALEAEVLSDVLLHEDRLVLATGGGAPCQPGAMDALLGAGPVVWLDAPPEALVARALTATRPLLAGRSPDDATRVLAVQLAARGPHYARATLRVDAGQPLEEVVSAIDRGLGTLVGVAE